MKETFYFSHDYNSRTDEKIKIVIRKHGAEGYGIYWMLIEDLYQNANALQTDYEGIAYDYRVEQEIIQFIVEKTGLFEIKDNIFSSKSVERRLEERLLKSSKARESAEKRWKKKDANAMQTQSDSNAIKESKGKEKKENTHKEIFDFWNTQKIVVHNKNSSLIKNQIDIRLKDFSVEDIKKSILNYENVFHSEKTYFNHKWTLQEFLQRKNGMPVFLYKKEEDYLIDGYKNKSENSFEKDENIDFNKGL